MYMLWEYYSELQFQVINFNKFLYLIDPCPKSDQHLISPYNISPESNIKVMRIKEMITN